MNYIMLLFFLIKFFGSLRSYNLNLCFLFINGEVYLNFVYDYGESDFGSFKLEYDYEDLKSVRIEVKVISGLRKKINDFYELIYLVLYCKR